MHNICIIIYKLRSKRESPHVQNQILAYRFLRTHTVV